MAKYLAEILKPVVGKSEHHVVNSKEFVTKMEQIRLSENDILVSFDAVSLFTNVPVEEACIIAKERHLSDSTLPQRTNLSPENIYDLLKLCLTTTCFQWREKYYEQTYGAPMGSPLSPVMANLFMEEFEKNALATATLKPGFWLRYVDDTLSSWCHGLDNLQRFLDHINSLYPSIKFTYEVQKDDKTIPFLDVLFTVREDGSLGHKVYRKPTHTDRYLHFNSFQHPSIKNSVCKTLINRAKTICEVSNIDNELENLRNVLKLNGYPRQFIDKAMKMPQRVQQKTEYQSLVCLPYIGPASHKIERILKEVGVQVYYSSQNKLFRSLCTHKDSRRNLVCTVFLVNVVWFTLVKLAEISLNVLKNIRLIARKLSLINRLWLNMLGLICTLKLCMVRFDVLQAILWNTMLIFLNDFIKKSKLSAQTNQQLCPTSR